MSHQPFVPEKTEMKEFSLKALLIGLVLTVVLGSANAYLGLRAGMTIAATYPAAVIGMAVLKIMRGSILEENIARTVGSIGESVAAGAIFTIPAFLIAGVWTKFNTVEAYLKTSALLFVGGLLGILFVTFLRRVMVTDPDLTFPESVAAAEIHKAGQKGSAGAKHLFPAMGIGLALLRPRRGPTLRREQGIHHQDRKNRGEHRPPRHGENFAHRRRRRHGLGLRTGHLSRLPRRRIHHRPAPGLAQLRRRRAGLGALRPAPHVLPRPRADRQILRAGRGHGRCRVGRTWSPTSGNSSSGRSPSAACSSAPDTPFTGCGKTSPPA